jgi:hypothetical protein
MNKEYIKYYVYAYLDTEEIINTDYFDIRFKYRPIYIGKGKNRRISCHFNNRKRLKNYFYNKLNKMIDNGNYPLAYIIKTFDNEMEALRFEILLIKSIGKVKDGGYLYNITDGGEGCSGFKHSDESRIKMKESHKGVVFTKEHMLKFSKSRLGKKHSEETKKKQSDAKVGKHPWNYMFRLSETQLDEVLKKNKSKLSKSKIGKTPWNYNKSKDIILQIDMYDNIVREWVSLVDLEIEGYQKSNVINVCVGKRKSHRGYKWIYKTDYTNNYFDA